MTPTNTPESPKAIRTFEDTLDPIISPIKLIKGAMKNVYPLTRLMIDSNNPATVRV